jgi:hypothetical protein
MKNVLARQRDINLNDLNSYIHFYHKDILTINYTKKDLNNLSVKKVFSFIINLKKKKGKFKLTSDSFPPCIFSRSNSLIKEVSFKDKDIVDNSCKTCIYFRRKECNGELILEDKTDYVKKKKFIGSISVHDIPYLSQRLNNDEKVILNNLLNKWFIEYSHDLKEIFWDYPSNLLERCNYDFMFHFIEGKIKLNKKTELLLNKRVIMLIKKTYDIHKDEYIKKRFLVPRDNRWTKLIIMMCWLDIFSEKERLFWIKKYSYYLYSEDEAKFPQAWNRVWALVYGLGINNLNDLKKIKGVNFNKAKKIILSYIPKYYESETENCFSESQQVMIFKYISIKKFCNIPLFKN